VVREEVKVEMIAGRMNGKETRVTINTYILGEPIIPCTILPAETPPVSPLNLAFLLFKGRRSSTTATTNNHQTVSKDRD
jgi:hypothetical protein